MDIIYRGVKAGRAEWNITPVTETLRYLEECGAQAVILGCTELPLAFSIYHINSGLPLIDPYVRPGTSGYSGGRRICARGGVLYLARYFIEESL